MITGPESFLNDKGEWNCIKCGACCIKAGKYSLPKFNNGDGCCKYLTKDNLCSIYENRPEICKSSNYKKIFTDELIAKACYHLWINKGKVG